MNILNIPTGFDILRMNSTAFSGPTSSPDLVERFDTLREVEIAVKTAKQKLERQRELKRRLDTILRDLE